MITVTVHHAKTHLSKLLAAVEAGDEFVIARGSKPVAMLSAVDAVVAPVARPRRVPGIWGHLEFSEESNAALCAPFDEDIIDEWERRDIGDPY